ncbi:MAG: cupin domain-containing protein [Rothia sp. (in: high G+C Gram-positive bacteria)]|nr:cupin domain-containing protein [Rothia sp. (in: high G+C Gram-positive bacteria)]
MVDGEVMKVCREVEIVTGMRCTATAYFTGPGEKGLLPHIDEEEVVMVQVAGAKKWVYSHTVYDHLAIPRTIDVKELSSVKVNEYNLESENFLAFPSGTIHAGKPRIIILFISPFQLKKTEMQKKLVN